MKPFFSFFGSKWSASRYYPKPKHDLVVEPFAGSAGYSTFHNPKEVILIDKDPNIIAIWNYLTKVNEQEILSLPDVPLGGTVDDLSCIPQEAKLLIGFWIVRGAERPRKTPGRWMKEGLSPNAYWGASARQRIASQISSIRHWHIMEGDYKDAPCVKATWFIDPPYSVAGKTYRYNIDNHDEVGNWCRERLGQTIVCEKEGANWLPFESFRKLKATTRKNIVGGRTSKEVVWVCGN